MSPRDGSVSLDFADFNDDGRIDMIAAYANGGELTLAIAYFDQTSHAYGDIFTSPDWTLSIDSLSSDSYVSAADFDRDGDHDLLIVGSRAFSASTTVIYLENSSKTQPQMTEKSISGINPPFQKGHPSVVDIDGDEDPDLIITSLFGKAEVYENDGTATFTKVPTPNAFLELEEMTYITQADIDFNDLDQYITYSASRSIQKYDLDFILDTSVIRTFADPGIQTTAFGELHFHDFDHDGTEDLLVSSYAFVEDVGFQTRWYLVSQVQECYRIRHLRQSDNMLSGTYRAQDQIILEDDLQVDTSLGLVLSAKETFFKGVFTGMSAISIDNEGCKSRF